jgi:P2 family phage major capsid protein
MQTVTRAAFNRYLDQQAALNQVEAGDVRSGKAFTVEPSVQQKLIGKQQESIAFLKAINVVQVPEMSAEKIGLGMGSTLASRTDTTANDRATQDPSTLDNDTYTCKQTNSDTHITYAKLDLWAKFKDFQARVSNQIVTRQGLDRIMIGFNGTSAAAATNRGANPLLQDVNVGWLKHLRDFDGGSHVMAEGSAEDGKVIIAAGADGDYANIHSLIYDVKHNLLPSWAREDDQLVAILGSDLLHDTFFPLVNGDQVPTETQAAQLIMSAKRVGGLKATTVPFFPASSILITRLDNLSIYEQDGKRRRTVVDNAKRDRIETYESSNDAYVVESYDYACLIDNIQFGATPEG